MYSELPNLAPWAITTARLLLGLALLLSGWRLVVGPDVPNRIVAMELIAALLMAQFILLVPDSGYISYLDVAFGIAMISFLGTVAFARYLEKRKDLL